MSNIECRRNESPGDVDLVKKAEFHPSTFCGSLFDIRHSLFQIEPQNTQCRISNVEGMIRRAMSV
jgi:hypothetical protein